MTRPSSVPRTRATTALAFACAALPWALLAWRYDFVCDDAYISFRYSRHWAEGFGLVFNRGESPPVEGYSNFLWVAWLALFERLGVDVTIAARATSAACALALLACVVRQLARRLAGAPLLLCSAFLGCLSPIAVWTTGGLETMAFALATFAVFALLYDSDDAESGERARTVRRTIAAGACAAAASLLRADGALWAGLAIVTALATRPRSWTRERVRAAALPLTLLTAAVVAHVAWRRSYYGEWLPNTALVKAGLASLRLERGLCYAGSLALALPACTLAIAGAAFVRTELARRALFFCLAAIAYAVYVGGDFMPMGRFVVPALPFVALAFSEVVRALAARHGTSIASVAGVAGIVLAVLPSFDVPLASRAVRERVHFRWNDTRVLTELEMWRGMKERAESWALLGRALGSATKPGESIVLGNIGATGYYSELTIYDVFGLTSREVARRTGQLVRASPGHDKAVGPEFFFDRRPDYLGAYLSHADAPPNEGLPPSWSALVANGRARLERHPLRPPLAFPTHVELRLLRLLW
ncbi:MAG: hypothetical protein ACKVWV_15210 [Planctomycetota bacterium]